MNNNNDLQSIAEEFNNRVNGLTVFDIRKKNDNKELATSLADMAYEISLSLMDLAGNGTPEYTGWKIPFYYTDIKENLSLKEVDREFKLTKSMSNDLTSKLLEALIDNDKEKFSLLSPLYINLKMRVDACLLNKRA